MLKATTIGLDIAKQIFQVHGADKDGKAVRNRSCIVMMSLIFLRSCRSVWSALRPVAAPITGIGASVNMVTLFV